MWGSQTSGDAVTFSIANEDGTFNSMGTFALATAGTEINIAGRDNNIASYFSNIRVTFASNGVRQRIRKIALLLKPIGNPVS